MNTPTPITEEHKGLWTQLYNLAHDEIFDFEQSSSAAAHQLIADSEARAVAALTAERDQLRAEVERLTKQAVFDGDHIHTLNAAFATRAEVTDANARAERAEAQLHALRLVCGTTDANKFETWTDRANARAERAEAELAAEREKSERYRLATLKLDAELAEERARLDWLESDAGVDWQWSSSALTIRRAVIDAAMKEDAQ